MTDEVTGAFFPGATLLFLIFVRAWSAGMWQDLLGHG